MTGQVSDEPLATLAEFRALGSKGDDVFFAQNALAQVSTKQDTIHVDDVVEVLVKGEPVFE